MCNCEGREHRSSPCYLCRAIEVDVQESQTSSTTEREVAVNAGDQ